MKGATKCPDGTFGVRLLLGGKQRVIRRGISDEAYAARLYAYARWYFAPHMKRISRNAPPEMNQLFDSWCLEAKERLLIEGVLQSVVTCPQVSTNPHTDLELRLVALEARIAALERPELLPTTTGGPFPGRVEDDKIEMTVAYRGKGPTVTVTHNEAVKAMMLRAQDPDAGRFQDSPKPQPEDCAGFDLA